MINLKKEFNLFATALMFYTRFPIKNIKGWSDDMLNKSTKYFPLIGILVGSFSALIFLGTSYIFPIKISLLITIALTVLSTGAFHEDGFADFCDGLGGGINKKQILDIMKDSRIGTYGTVGLILMFLIKYITLLEISPSKIPFILIISHGVSRVFPVLLIYTSEYVRMDLTSKSKPIGQKDSLFSLVIAIIFGFSTLILLPWTEALVPIIVLFIIFLLFRIYVKKRLGGYTGDILGALQTISEVFFLLSIVAIENYK